MTTLEKEFPDIHKNLIIKADAEKLFMQFMEVMRQPCSTATLDIKLKKLYQDGMGYGF
tara:strand:- start:50 stop:223 length:174 start_codon:yes stop_codon:yes gene_type:complete